MMEATGRQCRTLRGIPLCDDYLNNSLWEITLAKLQHKPGNPKLGILSKCFVLLTNAKNKPPQ
jgi:hypothetical protein